MACHKSLTIAESSSDVFTPLDNAVYVPSINKIIGTMENYIVKFNGTTGAYESAVKVISPMYGPMGICLVNGVPWISCWNDQSIADPLCSSSVRKDIFRLNPTTFEAEMPGLGLPAQNLCAPIQWMAGPTMIRGDGDWIYFLYVVDNQLLIGFIDSTNPLSFSTTTATDGLWCEQFGLGVNSFYTANPLFQEIWKISSDLLTTVTCDVSPSHFPVGVEYVNGYAYAVCGTKWLLIASQYNEAPAFNSHFYEIDLESLIPETGIKPIRIRYNSVDGNIYIPVQNKDGVIVIGASSNIGSTTTSAPFTILAPGNPTVVNLDAAFTGLAGDTIYVAGYGTFEVLIIAGNDVTVDNIDAAPLAGIVPTSTAVTWFTPGTATWKTGFDSPVDVVFTASKKFAVQSGLVGIREIT